MRRTKLPSAVGVACHKLIVALGLVVGSLGIVASSSAAAAENLIVAFGVSQTYGKGVSRDKAYPAQLEQLLRLKGYDVRVVNSGVNGQTTGTMLQRLEESVPTGTSLVIFQPGGNDQRKGLGDERAGNISAIRERLSARGIPVIMMENKVFRKYPRQADGQHLTAAGYRSLAQSLVLRVTKFLSK
jgi:acyl-CoA thioesterase I